MVAAYVVAVILGGIAGCLATAFVANRLAGLPFAAIAGKPGKYLWAVIYAIPLPWIATLGGMAVGTIISLIWLAVAPSAGAKFYWGPKDAPWARLLTLHAGYAIATLAVYWIVLRVWP